MATLRRAVPADAPAIALIHVRTWQHAYRGIVPQAFLDGMDVARRALAWARQLSDPANPEFVVVAEDGGALIGFASGGPPRNPELPFAGELYAIYLLPERQGSGVGRALFRAVVDHHLANGVTSMYLWVLADNAPARRFYERMGGVAGDENTFELGGAPLREIAYGWVDLRATAR